VALKKNKSLHPKYENSRKLLDTLEIIEQKKAFCTQIDTTMLAHYLGLPDVLGAVHASYVSKPIFKHTLSKTAEMKPATVTSPNLLMEVVWTIQSRNW
jgi:hypothetical protein